MFNGDRVKQVRELCGLTQTELAKRVGKNQSAIAQIESGLFAPTEEVVKSIVEQIEFPLNFFKQSTSTGFPLGSLLFRARALLKLHERRQVRQYARTVYEIVEKMEAKCRTLALRFKRLNDDAITAARKTRALLGIPSNQPIANLINTIEKNGVLVMVLPIEINNIDAFSAWVGTDMSRPVIAITGSSPGCRLRFSTSHEIGHLVLHQAVKGEISAIEREANLFASEFLMPKKVIRQELLAPISSKKLVQLKKRWKVSIQALIRRAYDLETISQRQYKYLMQQISKRGWRKREPKESDIPIEQPRAISQMSELIYGLPVNYRQFSKDMNLPYELAKDIITAHTRQRKNLDNTIVS